MRGSETTELALLSIPSPQPLSLSFIKSHTLTHSHTHKHIYARTHKLVFVKINPESPREKKKCCSQHFCYFLKKETASFSTQEIFFCLSFFLVVPRTSLTGLQSTVTALSDANYMTDVLDSAVSIPTHLWAVANKDKLSNKILLSEYNMCLQLRRPKKTFYLTFFLSSLDLNLLIRWIFQLIQLICRNRIIC